MSNFSNCFSNLSSRFPLPYSNQKQDNKAYCLKLMIQAPILLIQGENLWNNDNFKHVGPDMDFALKQGPGCHQGKTVQKESPESK